MAAPRCSWRLHSWRPVLAPFPSLRYLLSVLRLRHPITLLVFASWVAFAAAPYCQAAETDSMPCCKKGRTCAEGLRSPGCCRVEPGKSSPRPAGDSLPTTQKQAGVPLLAAMAPAAAPAAPVLAVRSEWVTRSPGDAVPLYLLNVSILR